MYILYRWTHRSWNVISHHYHVAGYKKYEHVIDSLFFFLTGSTTEGLKWLKELGYSPVGVKLDEKSEKSGV